MKPLLLTLTLGTLFLAQVTYAQDTIEVSDGVITNDNGFVSCEGRSCSACDFVVLGNTAIKWLVTISFLFFAVLAVSAGIKLITSQGNPSALGEAKSAFTNAFIGLIIILLAYLLVDTIMRQLVKGNGTIEGYGPWSQVQCSRQVESTLREGYFDGDETFVAAPSAEAKELTLKDGSKIALYPCEQGEPDLRTANVFGKSLQIHKNLVPSLQRIDAQWRRLGGAEFYAIRTIGGYRCTRIAGNNDISNHAYGIALDINAETNPHQETLETDMPIPFVNLFKREGWGWGGDWRSSKDAMHFSKWRGEQGDMIGEGPSDTAARGGGTSGGTQYVGAWGTNVGGGPAETKRETKRIIEHAFSRGATSFVVVPPNTRYAAQRTAVVEGVNEIVAEKGYRVTIRNGVYGTADPLHLTNASTFAGLGTVFVGDSNAARIGMAAGSGANRNAACVGWSTKQIADRFISGGTAFANFSQGRCQ